MAKKKVVIELAEEDARRIWRELNNMKDLNIHLERLKKQIRKQLPPSEEDRTLYSF